jgi:predicted membrane protein
MENQELQDNTVWANMERRTRRGKIVGGLFVVGIGTLFLMKELGVEIPQWVLTWKMLLIGIGLVTAIKHRFTHPGWLILVGIGGIYLLNDIYPDLQMKPFLWPILIIMAGIAIMFKPRRSRMERWKRWQQKRQHYAFEQGNDYFEAKKKTDEDFIDSVSLLGGSKKNILSKKFRGGDIVNIFGGCQLNLTQADIEPNATLEITQVFGGTKLIIPANWEIKSDTTVTVFGGIEDKRPMPTPISGEERKVLTLNGTTVFGGIEIKSFD